MCGDHALDGVALALRTVPVLTLLDYSTVANVVASSFLTFVVCLVNFSWLPCILFLFCLRFPVVPNYVYMYVAMYA